MCLDRTADLAITAAVGPRASGPGFTYTLIVTNNGPATATGVRVTNDLPQGLDQITPSQGGCSSVTDDLMLCALGALPSRAEATVTIDVIPTEVDTDTLPTRAAVNGEQHDPNTQNNFALTSALDLPTPQSTCSNKRCRLRLRCNRSDLLQRRCDNQITLFVDTGARRDTRTRRLSDERAARQPRFVRFAAASGTFAGGETGNLPLKITSKGKNLAHTLIRQGKKKLRGMMQMRNNAGGGGGTNIIRLRVRLR